MNEIEKVLEQLIKNDKQLHELIIELQMVVQVQFSAPASFANLLIHPDSRVRQIATARKAILDAEAEYITSRVLKALENRATKTENS